MIVDDLAEPLHSQVPGNNLADIMMDYRSCVNPLLMENREEKLSKAEKLDIDETDYKWQTS